MKSSLKVLKQIQDSLVLISLAELHVARVELNLEHAPVVGGFFLGLNFISRFFFANSTAFFALSSAFAALSSALFFSNSLLFKVF